MSTQETLQVFLARYKDLVDQKLVSNRTTLKRWMDQKDDPFPAPIQLASNSIAWDMREVSAWIDRRRKKTAGPAR